MFHKSGDVFEIRILSTRKGTVSGYFDTFNIAVKEISQYIGKYDIYMSLNPIKPELLARCNNHIQTYAKQTTSDQDISNLDYILIDLDPVRPSGISSTDKEKKKALKLAQVIHDDLDAKGFPEPILCDSGNGYHLLYGIDLENNKENSSLIRDFLNALDLLYSNEYVEVDRSTFNPSRIVKFYGTMACKGDSTEDRPHRWSGIMDIPEKQELVSKELIASIATQIPKPSNDKKPAKIGAKSFDLESWMEQHDELEVAFKAPFRDLGTKYILETCPWNNSHTNRSAYIIQFNNGVIVARCHHNSCQQENWQSLRQLLGDVQNNSSDDKGDDKKQADQIIELASDCQFFNSDLEEPFVAVPINNHWEVMDIKSQRFKLYLTKLYFENTQEAPNNDSMSQALKVLEMKSIFSETQRHLQRRIAKYDDCYYYDLGDKEWRAIKITKEGCSLEDHPPILFTRNKNMKHQVEPDFGTEPARLAELVHKNFRFKNAADRVLFTVYLVGCFLPQLAHVILVLYGEKGSAKSTTMRMVKQIVDPAMQDLLSMPTSKQDLAILLANTYMPAFDNLDSLSAEKSDLLCMAATGGAFSKRTLYTDSEETILRFKRCVALNGINVVTSRPDLLDRSIVLELDRIPKDERKTEDIVWAEFEQDLPAFLGAIINSLSKAISFREGVTLNQVGRMADFTYWGYAIAEVMGLGGSAFLNSYLSNQDRANEEALASNPVAAAVMALMRTTKVWSGSVTELLKQIENIANKERINTSVRTWPKDSFVLSKRLKEVKSNLEEVGIYYDIRHAGNFKKVTLKNKALQNVPKPKTDDESDDLK